MILTWVLVFDQCGTALWKSKYNYIYRRVQNTRRHYAVLPLSFAVKPLKCAESARHNLLACPDCQNLSKWGGKSMSNWQQTTIFIFTFTCMMLSVLCHQSSRANHRFPNCMSWSLDGSEDVCCHLLIKTCTASSYLARHGNCAALQTHAEKRKKT